MNHGAGFRQGVLALEYGDESLHTRISELTNSLLVSHHLYCQYLVALADSSLGLRCVHLLLSFLYL